MTRFLLAWVAGLLFATGLVHAAAAGPSPQDGPQDVHGPRLVERSDNDLVIVELRLGPWVLNDAVAAYLVAGDLLVPLGQVTEALALAVVSDPGSATAEGWILRENRRFSLDLARRQVLVEGRPAAYDEHLIELHSDDIYVGTTLLERWFPVDFELRLQRSQLLVHAREKLPVEEQVDRRRRWQRAGQDAVTSAELFPRAALPYRWLDWPMVDHTLTWNRRRGPGGAPRETVRSNLLAAGDLLRMSGEVALAFDGDGVSPRLRLGRRDPAAGLLGRLRATSFAFGDLFTPGRQLVALEGEARGFEVSSFPLDRPTEFDRTSLRGDALPGWEVELHHNETLIGFQTVGTDSRYEFQDVPLYYGLNLLRLVFHGPQGQRREKVERVLIGQDFTRPGESHYRFAVHEHGRRLFPESDSGPRDEVTAPELLPDGELGRDNDPYGQPRLFFELERGLRQNLALSWNLSSLPLEDGRHTYGGLGLLATRRGFLVNAHLAADTTGGWAGRVAAQGSLPGIDLRFNYERFFDFQSEVSTPRRPLASRGTLEIRSRLPIKRWPTTVVAGAEEERFADGLSSSALSLRFATRFGKGRLALAKTLQLRRDAFDTASRGLEGSWIVTAGTRAFKVRGGFGYAIEPRPRIRDVQWTAQWELSRSTHARLHLRQAFANDLTNNYQASFTRRFGAFALSLDARYDERSRLSTSLTLSHSFAREPHSGTWRTRSRSLATRGATAARVFLDHDLNGRFDPGDEPLEGVRLSADGGVRGDPTNRQGITWLTGLAPDRHVDLGLHLRSLEDPYWIPTREGVGLVARPGRVARVDLPVSVSAEVDGTVYRHWDDGREPVAGVRLQLVDPEGTVRYRARSAYDGFYLFDKVIPGRFILRVDPEQVARLELSAPPEREIVLGETLVMSGVDLVLEQRR